MLTGEATLTADSTFALGKQPVLLGTPSGKHSVTGSTMRPGRAGGVGWGCVGRHSGNRREQKATLGYLECQQEIFHKGELERESESHSVVSDSLQPHGLYRPWNSPGQNTGVGSLSLLPGIFPTPGIEPMSPRLQADSLPAQQELGLKGHGGWAWGQRGKGTQEGVGSRWGVLCHTCAPWVCLPQSVNSTIPQFSVSFPWCPLRSTQGCAG